MINGLMGVPAGFPRNDKQADTIAVLVDSIFPLQPRRAGAVFDAFTSNLEVNTMPLESIDVPTLIIHAKDDPLASYDAARRAAERIPGATLVDLESVRGAASPIYNIITFVTSSWLLALGSKPGFYCWIK